MVEDDLQDRGETPLVRKVRSDWYFQMLARVDDLAQRDGFSLIQSNLYRPLSDFVLETIENSIGLTVPTAIKSFYDQTDGLEVVWRYEADGIERGGSIQMHNFATVFGNWLDEIWGHQDFDADEPDFSWELRGIDEPSADPVIRHTVMHVPDGIPSYRLYYFRSDAGLLSLDLDFVDYVYSMVEARGVHDWQLLFADLDHIENATVLEAREKAQETILTLFPDHELYL